jgi:hypothetical protein
MWYRNLRKHLHTLIFACASFLGIGQNDTSNVDFTLKGYMDVYYGYDFSKPTSDQRLPFYCNYSRHNQVAINLGILQLNIDSDKYRARIGLQGGTYVTDNYANEPVALRYFSEASVGVSLSKKGKLWLDAGIMPSHIGFESAVNTENLTMSRSFIAELSPYYLCGGKLNWKPNPKLELEAIVCNGWQRINPLFKAEFPSFGTRITYSGDKFKINWSTYIGQENIDQMRYFSNLYSVHNLGNKLKMILDFDAGIQNKYNGSTEYEEWYGAALILQYKFSSSYAIGLRGEIFQDKENNVAPFIVLGSDGATAASVNFDKQISKGIIWRMEAKWITFRPEDTIWPIFTHKEDNYSIYTSLLFDLSKLLK